MVNNGTVKRQAGAEVSRFKVSPLGGFFFRSQQLTYKISIYTVSDLGVLSNLIGSLSLANEHYSPPTE